VKEPSAPQAFLAIADESHVKRERERGRALRATAWWKRRKAEGRCHHCGREFEPGLLTMDHLVPVARGGRSTKGNVVPACKECNTRKKHALPWEAELPSPIEPAFVRDREGPSEARVSPYRAWLQCIAGCDERFSVFDVIYRCPKCGDLLDVVHDVAALRDRSPAEWITTFEERLRRNVWPYGSGVWGKKEWVLPSLEDANVVSMYEGASNLFWADRYGRQVGVEDLWVKLCGNSHTGSFKDLGMTVLVSVVKQMIAMGKPIDAVACASTGDTSAALAAYCAAAGIPSIVLLPKDKVSPAQLVQPLANGALVLSLDTDFDGCMKVVQEITEDDRIYLANSMNSLRLEGQKTVGIELVQQFDWEVPDWIVIPGGNLGNVSALGKGFLLMKDLGMITKLPRIAVAQAAHANPLYLSYLEGFRQFAPVTAKRTLASAIQIGNPVSVNRAIRVLERFDGVVEQATEQELADESARADRTGMFNCPHTGVALAAFTKLVAKGVIRREQRVVVISTAHGLKFAEQKAAYHLGRLEGIRSTHANLPVELAADPTAVRDAIARHADRVRAAG
jgi:threonine synthase